MKANIKLSLEVWDKNNKGLIKVIKQEGNSLVRNFLDMVLGAINDMNRTCKDLTGVSYSIRFPTDFNATGLNGIIGTSDTAESIEDYTLTNYKVSFRVRDLTIESLLIGYKLSVKFDFEIMEAIIIKEVGIYQKLFDTGGTARDILLIRNVLNTPVEITEPVILTLTYEIEWAV